MASSYTLNKFIEQPEYNSFALSVGGWSVPINDDLAVIDTALGGRLALNATGPVGTVNLTSTETQNPIITITGAMTGDATYTLPANWNASAIVGGQWIVYNNTSGNHTVTITPISGGGTSVVCAQGLRSVVYSDGINIAFADTRVQPGGADTEIQFKSGGAFSASSKMTFDGTTTTIDTLDVTNNLSVGNDVLATGDVSDGIGNLRTVPVNSQTASYVLLASDAGKFISITTGGVTMNTGVFTVGENVTIYNNSGSSQTITQGSGVTLRQVGTATTGSRTIAQYGLATLLCVATNTYVVTGAGVT